MGSSIKRIEATRKNKKKEIKEKNVEKEIKKIVKEKTFSYDERK